MNIKIALPGDRYYSVPLEVLEKYAVAETDFNSALENEGSIFEDDVAGQSYSSSSDGASSGSGWGGSSSGGTRTVALGVRG
ncbi:hypothetical protein [Marinobacter lipolyticus]|uniref:hypothetical protein n=1 Tax=Marinobacter lipolyticus TaxID=209639 RepID=UPI003A8CC1FB